MCVCVCVCVYLQKVVCLECVCFDVGSTRLRVRSSNGLLVIRWFCTQQGAATAVVQYVHISRFKTTTPPESTSRIISVDVEAADVC